MGRPQGSMALFDLLDQADVGTSGGRTGSVRPQSGDRSPPVQVREVGMKIAASTASVVERAISTNPNAGGPAARRPLVRHDGDALSVSLTSARMAVVVFVLLALVAGAFEFGRRRGDRNGFVRGYDYGRESYAAGAVTDIEAARQAPPAHNVVSDLAVGRDTVLGAFEQATGRSGPIDPNAVAWVSGHTYVVVQGFREGRAADATQAQAFLSGRGVETVLVTFDSGAMQLITAQGFNRSDAAQDRLADRLLEEVRRIGADYFASGGGYKLEGYFATFRGGRW